MRAFAARLRTAAWLGWQIESNWTDPFLFVIYGLMRPLATAFIIVGMYWAVAGQATRPELFASFFVANAFHIYVTNLVVGMGWLIVEDREDYHTLIYVYTSPIGMFTYLAGRGSVKLVLGTVSMLVTLTVGWFALGIRWDWAQVAWLPFLAALALGIISCTYLGFLVAGTGLLLPKAAITINEGLAVTLYLVCGVIFPVDLLPHGLREIALALPFTYWYEALRRFLLGHGASSLIGSWPDGTLLAILALTTLAFVIASRWGYGAFERRARRLGRLDQGTLF